LLEIRRPASLAGRQAGIIRNKGQQFFPAPATREINGSRVEDRQGDPASGACSPERGRQTGLSKTGFTKSITYALGRGLPRRVPRRTNPAAEAPDGKRKKSLTTPIAWDLRPEASSQELCNARRVSFRSTESWNMRMAATPAAPA